MKTIVITLMWLTTATLVLSGPSLFAQSITDSGKVYTTAEKQPEFPGGKAALSTYLAQNIKFPNSLLRKNYNAGPVSAKFIVDKDGSVHDVRISTKPLDNKETRKGMQEYMTAIITAIEKMPRWRPGQVGGQPVAVFYTLPIEVNL